VTPKKRLKAAVSLCKLSDWDPDTFLSVRDIFLEQAQRINGPSLDDVLFGLTR
jgi:hypothetical protein